MDLSSFIATQLATQNTSSQKKATKELLPTQQQQRSYTQTKKDKESAPPITLSKFYYGEKRGKWIMHFKIDWPFNYPNKDQVLDSDIKKFAEHFIVTRSNRGDDKYIKTQKANKREVIFEWDIDRWLNDNFRSPKRRFKPPLTLEYRIKQDVPLMIYSEASLIDLGNFIETRFQDFLENKSRLLDHNEFNFLERISSDLFTYKIVYRESCIKASLRYSVVLGALAGYMVYKHKKEFNKSEIKNLKRKVSRFSDVKHLDRYIKRI